MEPRPGVHVGEGVAEPLVQIDDVRGLGQLDRRAQMS